MNPPESVCPKANIRARINAEYFDNPDPDHPDKEILPFHGVFLTTNLTTGAYVLSMEGKIDIKPDAKYPVSDTLYNDNWHRTPPGFCISSDGSATINWFASYYSNDANDLKLTKAVKKYVTIISGQHCLVYNSQPVFEQYPIKSGQGKIIADWGNLRNVENHHNSAIGSGNCESLRRRTFLGHLPDGSFLLVCADGDND